MARAVASEAGVPFFSANGSEFEECLIGLGASRVRELFKNARKKAPCVIFIDEIDSVGAKRQSAATFAGQNQTINQLLVEMDGFCDSKGVIVLAATNRREALDEALVRPGRFDLEIKLPTPDLKARTDLIIHEKDAVRKCQHSTSGTRYNWIHWSRHRKYVQPSSLESSFREVWPCDDGAS